MEFNHLQTLVDYHYWARDRVFESVQGLSTEQLTRDLGNSFPSLHDTLVHLYGADWIWCSRWEGESPDAMPAASSFADIDAIRVAWVEQERRIRAVVSWLGPAGVLQPIEYVRNGVRQAQPFWQLLQHLVNHGSYHRGQITTMLRQIGADPPESLDLITFYRERANVPT